MRQTTDLDFLLYPLAATKEMPFCPECGAPMTIAVLEAREGDNPDFSTFRCAACQRSERFVIEGALK
jgi:transposase-like protein